MHILVLAIVATLFGANVSSSPIVAPLDQSSTVIVVGNVSSGARVDVYANAVWIGSAIAPAHIVSIHPLRDLIPGDVIIAVERRGAFSSYGVNPTVVANDYTTYHYDNMRTGWNKSETSLTQAAVSSSSFGELFSTPVDGNVVAQPLFVSGVAVPSQGTHDIVYVATENDSLYALDAASGNVLWRQNYVNATQGFSPVQQPDIRCPFIAPVIGITGTPVISRSNGTMYFDTAEEQTGATTTFHHFLHAVDIATGLDRPGSPTEIVASVTAPGGGQVTFDPQWELQRPGLLLDEPGNAVYVAFGSFCDLQHASTHGWILGYSTTDLTQFAVFNASPGSKEGLSSFWAGGYGIASDNHSIYAATGNGEFNGNTGGALWGDSVLKFNRSQLAVTDYFAPYNQATLNMNDVDLGGGGPMVLPVQAGAFAHLLVEEGKATTLYLINRDHMGRYTAGGPDKVLQELEGEVGTTHGVWGGPGYYVSPSGQPVVFYCGGQDHLKAFAVMSSPMTGLMMIDSTVMTFHGEGGTIPSVTSNGTAPGTPVVWALERPYPPAETVKLRAFAADNLRQPLVNLAAGPWLNPNGGFFPVATVIDSRVYVGSANAVTGFGLH